MACTAPSKCKFFQLYFDFLTIFCRFSSSLQHGSLSAHCGPIYANQGVQGDVLAGTAPSQCKFLLLYFDFLTIFRRFLTSLQRGSPSPPSVGIQIAYEVRDDGLACPEPSKGESFQLNFDFLKVFLQFSHYLHLVMDMGNPWGICIPNVSSE